MAASLDKFTGAAGSHVTGSKWDELAKLDPLWIILHEPDKKHGRWAPDEFFSTGEAEVSAVLNKCLELGISLKYERALDFGCGVGRLTRAFASRFSQCVGIDVSGEMISQAQEFNRQFSNCEFVVSRSDRLRFPNESFDFVSTFIVLQHIDTEREILSWIAEFARILRPGGTIVFQLPDKPSLRRRIQGRRRLWSLLHFLGMSERSLYEMLGLTPITMNGVAPYRVREVMEKAGLEVISVQPDSMAGPDFHSYTYFGQKVCSATAMQSVVSDS
jgi:ubiquinone/menaquinone biosynthesis C-methylase UbiE